jgi:hypothetical protein
MTGIPPSMPEEAFFPRGGGSGFGLAIAGENTLGHSPQGGLGAAMRVIV